MVSVGPASPFPESLEAFTQKYDVGGKYGFLPHDPPPALRLPTDLDALENLYETMPPCDDNVKQEDVAAWISQVQKV